MASSGNTTNGYNLNADKVALVVDSATVPMIGSQGVNNCNSTTFTTAAPNDTCIVAAGSRNFLWIEGKFIGNASGTAVSEGLGFATVKFSRVHLASFGNTSTYGIYISSGSNYNRFSQVRTFTTGQLAFYNDGAAASNDGNIYWDIVATNGGNDGFSMYQSHSYNVISGLLVTHTVAHGFMERGGFSGVINNNVYTRLTVANNVGNGIYHWADGGTLSGTIYHLGNVAGNGASAGTAGFFLDANAGNGGGTISKPTISQFVLSRNLSPVSGLRAHTVTTGLYTGNLIFGNNATTDCTVVGGSPGINATCDPTGSSDHNKVTGVDMRSNFVLDATSDSVNTFEDANGETSTSQNLVSPYTGWDAFQSFYRVWGGDDNSTWPAVARNGLCLWSSNSLCQIYDFALKSTATVALKTTGTSSTSLSTNGTPSASACPTAAAGSQYLTSNTYTYDANYFGGINGIETAGGDSDGICEAAETCVQRYLKSAVEIIDDLSGDDDGLCEKNERCIYAPNFGAYQGHGTLTECTFTEGTVTGVTMYYYPSNGY